MSMPRDREAQVKALDVRSQRTLEGILTLTEFRIPDYCLDCPCRSDDCAAGTILNIKSDTQNFEANHDLFIGREVTGLIKEVGIIPVLNRLAYDCVDRVESGSGPIDVDTDELIQQRYLENLDL
jgi:hypothetical protein